MRENKKRAIALGAFDGLHKGHMQVINSAVEIKELTPSVLTFKEDPSKCLTGHTQYLLTHKEKVEKIKKAGIKKVFELNFDLIKNVSAEEFVQNILINQFQAGTIICGFNFKFGKGAVGDINTLKKLCHENNLGLKVIPPLNMQGAPVSSTRIRQAIENGNIELANSLLGRAFGFKGKVITGNKIGRTLGFPTVNQLLPQGFVKPRFGVYASHVRVGEQWLPGVTNIGVKPTVGNSYPLAETWIPGINLNMYGMELELELHSFLRDEKKFNSLKELKEEIEKDAKRAAEIFNN